MYVPVLVLAGAAVPASLVLLAIVRGRGGYPLG